MHYHAATMGTGAAGGRGRISDFGRGGASLQKKPPGRRRKFVVTAETDL